MYAYPRGLNLLQKISMSLMGVLVMITFLGANLHAVLWQSSSWLVSTVLPAVVVDLTNEERAQNNAAPLRRSATLDAAAKLKAEDMVKNEYFAHFSPSGVTPWHWFDEAGYVYAHAGENLAIHFTDSAEVVEAWMDSPAHRQNIVNGVYTEIGVGTAKGKYDGYNTVYVVQLFGTPAVAPAPEREAAPVEIAKVIPTEVVSEIVETEVTPELVVLAEDSAPSAQLPEESVVALESVQSDTEIVISEPVLAVEPEVVNESVGMSEPADLVVEDMGSELVVSSIDEVVVIQSPLISTSSGLAIARITAPNDVNHAGATVASIVTQPNALLQFVYMILGSVVLFLLGISVVVEARRFHYMQVAYGMLLLLSMGGLWFVHTILTEGAVIV